MNNILIDQLKLAIQVEEGSVDQMEIQYRRKGYEEWLSPTMPAPKGWAWDFDTFEYRRKPRPLECEVVVADGRIFGIRGTIHEGNDCKILKMREVTND